MTAKRAAEAMVSATPGQRLGLLLGAALAFGLLLGFATLRLLDRGEAFARQSAEARLAQLAEGAREALGAEARRLSGLLALLAEQEASQAGGAEALLASFARTDPEVEFLLLPLPYQELLDQGLLDQGLPGGAAALPAATALALANPPAAGLRWVGPFQGTGGRQRLLLVRRDAGNGRLALADIPAARLAALLEPFTARSGPRLRVEVDGGGPLDDSLPAQPPPPSHAAPLLAGRASAHGITVSAWLPAEAALAGWMDFLRRLLPLLALLLLMMLALVATAAHALTLRRLAATEREAAARRLADAVESLPEGIVLWDAGARLIVCNSRFRALFGGEAAGLVPGLHRGDAARRIVRLGVLAPKAVPLAASATGGAPEIALRDGRWLLASERAMPGGGSVVMYSEVTALKQANTRLAEARDAAEGAMGAKSRLLAHVSHELRTPLASLLRLAEALSGAEAVPATQRRHAAMVGAAARHLLALANEVLDLAALEARRLTLQPEPCAPADLVADAIAMIGPVAEAKGVALRHEAGALPALAQLDGTRVRQILLNLLSNAVKFTPPGSEVHVTSAAEEGSLSVRVRDQGPGVPELQRALLFREFSRLHPRDAEGTGLGLAISARLAALMGGELRYLPLPRGGCFEAVFPLAAAAAAPPAPAPAPALPLARLSVLAVDDSAANLAVLRALLANTGFALETVTEAEAAIEILVESARAGRPFDVVLMDVMMPGMDGMEATRRIRALPGMLGRVPVIAVTASAFPEDVAACRAAGMTGHVAKPVARDALLRAIAAVVAGPGPDAAGEAESLRALRPVFLAELGKRLTQLRAALDGGGPLIEPVHAIAGTVGHLDAAEFAELARRALRALRDGATEGPALARDLMAQLAMAFPELRASQPRAA